MRLSVVIPVYNGGEDLRRCLGALAMSTRRADELIVVDDSSTDASSHLARSLGAVVVPLSGGPKGPAFARNRGASLATGDVLVFLDGDVAAHPDTLAIVEKHLTEAPEIAALFGSYDDAPRERGLVTSYKNLLHHYVHQHSRREASTFWAGCGAIRREVFVALGGFSEHYAHPSIEDIELGVRLRRAGHRVWLCPDVQVTHLKCWRLCGLLRTDILERAVPWSRLILSTAHLPSELNLNPRTRLSAMAVWASLGFLSLGFRLSLGWLAALVTVMGLVALNADLYRFFAHRRGIRFAVGAFGLYVLYLLYSSLVFGSVLAWWLFQKAGVGIHAPRPQTHSAQQGLSLAENPPPSASIDGLRDTPL